MLSCALSGSQQSGANNRTSCTCFSNSQSLITASRPVAGQLAGLERGAVGFVFQQLAFPRCWNGPALEKHTVSWSSGRPLGSPCGSLHCSCSGKPPVLTPAFGLFFFIWGEAHPCFFCCLLQTNQHNKLGSRAGGEEFWEGTQWEQFPLALTCLRGQWSRLKQGGLSWDSVLWLYLC